MMMITYVLCFIRLPSQEPNVGESALIVETYQIPGCIYHAAYGSLLNGHELHTYV